MAKAALESVDIMKRWFIDGISVHYQGIDADDVIECLFCGYEVARNDDYIEMRPKHCPECGRKLGENKWPLLKTCADFKKVYDYILDKYDDSILDTIEKEIELYNDLSEDDYAKTVETRPISVLWYARYGFIFE